MFADLGWLVSTPSLTNGF